jgi:hypothetical protein
MPTSVEEKADTFSPLLLLISFRRFLSGYFEGGFALIHGLPDGSVHIPKQDIPGR